MLNGITSWAFPDEGSGSAEKNGDGKKALLGESESPKSMQMDGASPSSGSILANARTRAHRSSFLNMYRAALGTGKLQKDKGSPQQQQQEQEQEQQQEQQQTERQKELQQQRRQLLKKWRHLQSSGQTLAQAFAKRRERCQRLALRGIPCELRWEVWQAALDPWKYAQSGLYESLLQQETTWIKLIEADAPRTFPGNAVFEEFYLEKMKRVLSAYSAHDPEVGYCQGLNFVVGLLLITANGAEEDVFWVFVALMHGCSLRHFYKDGFPLLQQYSGAFSALLKVAIPELAEHFDEEGLDVSIFLQPWYLTLFATNLPLPVVCFLWDGIFTNGLPFLLNIGVTMLGNLRNALLEMRFEDMMAFFRTLNQGLDSEDGRRLLQKSIAVEIPKEIRKSLEVVI
mmetsp:Transcript_59340/g.125744  ORF Transcript_59340/g.125744 Transcript_59340/m.125744 type:complete len:398 (-) Transcript_59340:212-1405(-)